MELDEINVLQCRESTKDFGGKNKKCKTRRKRRWSVRPINRDWNKSGYHKKVFQNMKLRDGEHFFKHTRMSKEVFNLLLILLQNDLYKPKARIGPEERLSITLLYLAHECSLQSIAWSHKLGKTTVRNIVLETYEIIWRVLSPTYISEPTTSQFRDIANDFETMWDIPNCVGAIDGKHVAMKCPANSGSMFYNYKKHYSVVLMGVCDAKYTFISSAILFQAVAFFSGSRYSAQNLL
ncbi:uncharacterized protein LOC142232326 [Haematobia irritans]|uniref:uncharacterized protein LOC142232326 n=1 Tax=Haematobia irritans TaxID=7368 RepID=UPI003F502049